MAQGPEYLYRYRHLQGEHREYTRRILTNSALYFASPSSFNDPFDCRVHFDKATSIGLRKRYERILKERQPQLNREARRAKALSDTKRRKPRDVLDAITKSLQERVNQHGILSLSATNTNILLWSHYAAGHTGVCLQFSRAKSKVFFKRAFPIRYTRDYPEVTISTSDDWERVEALLLTKAFDWRYEEEWRIIDIRRGPGVQLFPEEHLTGVILGARMPQNDRDEVQEWLKERKSPVDVYEARVSTTSFSLEIVRYV